MRKERVIINIILVGLITYLLLGVAGLLPLQYDFLREKPTTSYVVKGWTKFTMPKNVSAILCMKEYQDKLYVGATNGSLFVFDGKNWSNVLNPFMKADVNCMAVMLDLLYLGLSDGRIYSYDGSTFKLTFDRELVKSYKFNYMYGGFPYVVSYTVTWHFFTISQMEMIERVAGYTVNPCLYFAGHGYVHADFPPYPPITYPDMKFYSNLLGVFIPYYNGTTVYPAWGQDGSRMISGTMVYGTIPPAMPRPLFLYLGGFTAGYSNLMGNSNGMVKWGNILMMSESDGVNIYLCQRLSGQGEQWLEYNLTAPFGDSYGCPLSVFNNTIWIGTGNKSYVQWHTRAFVFDGMGFKYARLINMQPYNGDYAKYGGQYPYQSAGFTALKEYRGRLYLGTFFEWTAWSPRLLLYDPSYNLTSYYYPFHEVHTFGGHWRVSVIETFKDRLYVGTEGIKSTPSAESIGGYYAEWGTVYMYFEETIYTMPSLSHTPVSKADVGADIIMEAHAKDPDGIVSVILSYKVQGQNATKHRSMRLISGTTFDGTYEFTIPAFADETTFDYYITAKDTDGNETVTATYHVIVSKPTFTIHGIDYRWFYILLIVITLGIGWVGNRELSKYEKR